MALIAALRIRGKVNVNPNAKKAMELLKLNRKNSLSVFQETPSIKGMLQSAKDFITFGPIEEKTFKKILESKKLEIPKDPKETNPIHLKPPKGGFKAIKKPFKARGDLGKRNEMDSLLERMI